jgi:CDP-diacylglycerol---glycerol-3-phosphate 3-phosphatidyltransferase
MNAANAITVARILLIPVFLVLLFSAVPYGEYAAVAVFALAAGTDKLDGYVARKRKTVTAAGMFLDPLADKLLISAALIALVSLDKLPAWVAMVIIGREFAVTGLRIFAAAQGVNIPADRLGKLKTVSQTVAVLFLLVVPESWHYGDLIGQILIYIAVALTLVSGIEYFWNGRDLLSRSQRLGTSGDEGEAERPCESPSDTGGGPSTANGATSAADARGRDEEGSARQEEAGG